MALILANSGNVPKPVAALATIGVNDGDKELAMTIVVDDAAAARSKRRRVLSTCDE